ncbi:MAG: hypothetical protein GX417_11965 [Clostridiales bacterium]|nr:hypothetical protein [Clostridiales bacterium]
MHRFSFFNRIVKPAVFAFCPTTAALCAACAAGSGFAPVPTAAPIALDLRDSGPSDITDLMQQTQLETLDPRGNSISIEDFSALASQPICR